MTRKHSGRTRERSGRSWLWGLAVVAMVALGVVWFVSFGSGQRRRAEEPSRGMNVSTSSLPDESVFARYGRSESCKACHAAQWELWRQSHHALAERLPDPTLDGAAFSVESAIRHGAVTSSVQQEDGRFEMVTTGRAGRSEPFKVERVIGHSPLRQFLISDAGGRFQVSELAFHPASGEWFDVFGEENRTPGEWGHWTGRGMTWNQMCASCHNTRLRKHYDGVADRYSTTMAERAIGCESCHGPMADHVEWRRIYNEPGRRDPTLKPLTRDKTMAVCGSCHARRGDLTGEFEPGESFADHFRLTIPDETDLYYADGQVRDENYEFTSFLSSRMSAAGVTCMDCHEPHSAKIRAPDNTLCQRCHETPIPPAPKIDALTHSRHAPGQGGDRCVDCHMPVTTYMQRHPRRDHGFTIPDPLLTKQHGIPNACNRCHKDRDADWALAAVEKWYGERMNRPSRVRTIAVAQARRGVRAVVPDLTRLAREEKIGLWRGVATRLLAQSVLEPPVQASILERVGDPDPIVRSEAALALELIWRTGDGRAETSLRHLLNDPARAVRLDAAWALRRNLDTNTGVGRELLESLLFNADQPGGAARLGVFYMDRGEAQAALPYWERAVGWDGHSAGLRDGLAVCLSVLGRTRDAVQQLKEACRLEPRDGYYRYKLGLALNESGQLAEAIAALEEAVKLNDRLAEAHYNLGLGYAALDRLDQALQALTRAESIDAQSSRIPYARATVLARLGRMSEARLAAQRVLELQPDSNEGRALLQQLGANE